MRLSTLRLGMAAAAAAAVAHAAPDATKAQAVKDAFRLSWKGYYDNAFPHDTLLPISRKYEDDR